MRSPSWRAVLATKNFASCFNHINSRCFEDAYFLFCSQNGSRGLLAVRSCRLVAAIGAAAVVIATAVYSRRRATLCLWWIQQRRLRRRLIETDLVDAEAVLLVGGVDVSFIKDSETDACAAIVVCSLPSLEVVYERYERVVLKAPYIPGYLAFREVDFLVSLLAELKASQPRLFPHVVLVDGNGILHPNRFGLACHLGVLAGVATVGVGKTLHCVDGLTREGLQRLTQAGCARAGDSADLVGDSGAVWGAALRTTDPDPKRAPKGAGTGGNALFKPVIVSIGHGLSLASALKLVRRCIKHRIPEPVRQADLRSREWLRSHSGAGGAVGDGSRCTKGDGSRRSRRAPPAANPNSTHIPIQGP